jgi:nitrous oxide reductase
MRVPVFNRCSATDIGDVTNESEDPDRRVDARDREFLKDKGDLLEWT